VASLDPTKEPSVSSSPLFAQPIHWHPLVEDITLVELFAGIGTGLAATLEAGLKVKRYIHVDNGVTPNWVACHHIQRLLTLYLKQLSPLAIYGCFGKLL